jgi:catechol 2,3-dioxygenase-like lactoylglutathione lyase family enzyme
MTSDQPLPLGAFSVSLTVKDLKASRDFYERLGFSMFGGDPEQNWLIMRNGNATIGLFQSMFERNSLTFNPGWNADAQPVDEFTDVRDIERQLDARGVAIQTRTEPGSSGPGFVIVVDPDGNPIFIDQHV